MKARTAKNNNNKVHFSTYYSPENRASSLLAFPRNNPFNIYYKKGAPMRAENKYLACASTMKELKSYCWCREECSWAPLSGGATPLSLPAQNILLPEAMDNMMSPSSHVHDSNSQTVHGTESSATPPCHASCLETTLESPTPTHRTDLNSPSSLYTLDCWPTLSQLRSLRGRVAIPHP